MHPVTLGVTTGLVLGKPLGIIIFTGLAVALGLARLPKDVNWMQLLGAACACGIGFTMSLFIAGLAFEHGSGAYFSGRPPGHSGGFVAVRAGCLGTAADQPAKGCK